MITRDSAASISGTAQNARQRLGEVIRHYREEREITKREVSRRCKISEQLVEEWETGRSIPGSDEWKALTRGMNRALNAYQELYLRARKEAEDEDRARAQPNNTNREQPKVTNNPSTKITTNLGAKLAAATAPAPTISIVRDPDPEQPSHAKITRAAMLKLPKGWKSHEMLAKRRAFALDILRQRPNISGSGQDSLDELLHKAFGVGLAHYTIAELRAQAKREAADRPMPIASPPPMQWQPPIVPVAAPTILNVPALAKPLDDASVQERIRAEAAVAPAHAGDIETAVQLVLEALPNLQTFTITVDEHGEASVDYQIRKVVITTDGGSFKVRR